MEPSRDRTTLYIIIAVVLALVCCLCLVLSGTAASVWFARQGLNQPRLVPTSPVPTPTVPDSSWNGNEVSPEARAMQERMGQAIVPISDPIALAESLEGKQNIPTVVAETAAPIPLGTVKSFWALNEQTQENFQVDAELAYATDHVYFWIEKGVDYNLDEVKGLVDEFENKSYPTDREFFGSEWTPGVDGDPHLYILVAGGLGGNIAGYYSSEDEYSPLAHEHSNAHEMFYLNADNVFHSLDYTGGVLAHEFQHMIHWYRDRNEETWMNEGFSDVAMHLNGFDVGGADYVYSLDPDQALTNWPGADQDSISHYGQAFLLLTYFLDRFGEDATKAVVAQEANGFDSIDQTLQQLGVVDSETGQGMTADEVFQDWSLAMLLNDRSVGDGRYSYTSYDQVPDPAYAESVSDCAGENQNRTVNQYGVDYIRITCPGTHTLDFEGMTLVPLLPEEPHSGDYAFWSNRGDESDMTLTRTFDLTDVSGPAALDYWVWFDIEDGWDYAYLEASTDGGQTWSIVQTPSGSDYDPVGSAYGWGYTGLSGGGSQAAWVQERVDLSAYAGAPVTLRFQYVTDAAVNGEGLLLDDIRLDAVGYQDGFETDDGGWEPAGFVRLYNQLPQTYKVALVERGGGTHVTYLPLDEHGKASTTFQIGDGTDEAILVVSGTARHTWQPAPYRYRIDTQP